MLLFSVLITLTFTSFTSGRTVNDQLPSITPPSFEDTPDQSFITLLGSELTLELASQDFDEDAVETAINKMFAEADDDTDEFLDIRELALWVHKNQIINKAVEIKDSFTEYDEDEDGQVTFHEFAVNGGLSTETAGVLTSRYTQPSGEVDEEMLSQDIAAASSSPGMKPPFNIANVISNYNDLFKETDTDKNGALSWEEFYTFSYAEDYENLHDIVQGQSHRHYDADTDLQYDFDEFDKWYLSHVIIPEIVPYSHRTPRDMFDACDVDGNGAVSYQEIDTCTTGYIDHMDVDEIMATGDENSDGKLSVDEVVMAFEFLTHLDVYFQSYVHDEF